MHSRSQNSDEGEAVIVLHKVVSYEIAESDFNYALKDAAIHKADILCFENCQLNIDAIAMLKGQSRELLQVDSELSLKKIEFLGTPLTLDQAYIISKECLKHPKVFVDILYEHPKDAESDLIKNLLSFHYELQLHQRAMQINHDENHELAAIYQEYHALLTNIFLQKYLFYYNHLSYTSLPSANRPFFYIQSTCDGLENRVLDLIEQLKKIRIKAQSINHPQSEPLLRLLQELQLELNFFSPKVHDPDASKPLHFLELGKYQAMRANICHDFFNKKELTPFHANTYLQLLNLIYVVAKSKSNDWLAMQLATRSLVFSFFYEYDKRYANTDQSQFNWIFSRNHEIQFINCLEELKTEDLPETIIHDIGLGILAWINQAFVSFTNCPNEDSQETINKGFRFLRKLLERNSHTISAKLIFIKLILQFEKLENNTEKNLKGSRAKQLGAFRKEIRSKITSLYKLMLKSTRHRNNFELNASKEKEFFFISEFFNYLLIKYGTTFACIEYSDILKILPKPTIQSVDYMAILGEMGTVDSHLNIDLFSDIGTMTPSSLSTHRDNMLEALQHLYTWVTSWFSKQPTSSKAEQIALLEHYADVCDAISEHPAIFTPEIESARLATQKKLADLKDVPKKTASNSSASSKTTTTNAKPQNEKPTVTKKAKKAPPKKAAAKPKAKPAPAATHDPKIKTPKKNILLPIDALYQKGKFDEACAAANLELKKLLKDSNNFENNNTLIALLYYRISECQKHLDKQNESTSLEPVIKGYLFALSAIEKNDCTQENYNIFSDMIKTAKENMAHTTIETPEDNIATSASSSSHTSSPPPDNALPVNCKVIIPSEIQSLIACLQNIEDEAKVFIVGGMVASFLAAFHHPNDPMPGFADIDIAVFVKNLANAHHQLLATLPWFRKSGNIEGLYRGVYGSFEIDIRLVDSNNKTLASYSSDANITVKSALADANTGEVIDPFGYAKRDTIAKEICFNPNFQQQNKPIVLFNFVHAQLVMNFEGKPEHVAFLKDHIHTLLEIAPHVLREHFHRQFLDNRFSTQKVFKLWCEYGFFKTLLPEVHETQEKYAEKYLGLCEKIDKEEKSKPHFLRMNATTLIAKYLYVAIASNELPYNLYLRIRQKVQSAKSPLLRNLFADGKIIIDGILNEFRENMPITTKSTNHMTFFHSAPTVQMQHFDSSATQTAPPPTSAHADKKTQP